MYMLTLLLLMPLRLYTLPYWSDPPFLIFDIRALWRSGLSAREIGQSRRFSKGVGHFQQRFQKEGGIAHQALLASKI